MKRTTLILLVALLIASVSVFLYSRTENAGTINGISVPPEPPHEENDATIAGIDANNNGVRDDVERLIAKNFGADPMKHREALAFSRAEHAMIVSSGTTTIDHYVDVVNCVTIPSKELDEITHIELSTRERSRVYGLSLAGMISKMGCQLAQWPPL